MKHSFEIVSDKHTENERDWPMILKVTGDSGRVTFIDNHLKTEEKEECVQYFERSVEN